MKIVQERFDYNEAVDIGLFSDKHEDKHYIVSKNQLKKRCKFNILNTSHVLHGVLLKNWEKNIYWFTERQDSQLIYRRTNRLTDRMTNTLIGVDPSTLNQKTAKQVGR